MAEIHNQPNGAFVSSVAGIGENLSSALIKFAAKWDDREPFISDLAMITSMIASLLQDIVTTLAKHGELEGPECNALRVLSEGLKVDFEKVLKALQRTTLKASPGRFVATFIVPGRDPEVASRRIVVSNLLRAELGADERIESKLGSAKDYLWCLYQGLRYLTLRKLAKAQCLQSEESKELEALLAQLPNVLPELELRQKFILEPSKNLKPKINLRRSDELRSSEPTGEVRPVTVVDHGFKAQQDMDDDVRSVASIDSFASRKYLDITEAYEAWVIRKFEGEKNWPRRSWSLLGLRVYEYENGSGYEIEPQSMTVDEMKAQSEVVLTGMLKPEQTAHVERTISSLPPTVQQEIRMLLEDRERVTTNERFNRRWKTVYIKTKPSRIEGPASGWMAWWKTQQETFSEVFMIIRGQTIDWNDVTKPGRYEDPFLKPRYRRSYLRNPVLDARVSRGVQGYERRPERHISEDNRERHDIYGLANSESVSAVQNNLSPEEIETKIQVILTESGTSQNHEESLVED